MSPIRLSAALLLAASASTGPHAQTVVSDARVTMLTALRPSGDEVTSADGITGWPAARYPAAPPLYAVRPGTSAGYLYGGFTGNGYLGDRPWVYTAVGLYSMRAAVSVYERVAYDLATDIQGRISSTPVKSSAGALYAVMTSLYGERNVAEGRASEVYYARTVGNGVIVRTDYDGAYPTVVEASRGKLYAPNGALVIDAADKLYGIDKGPQGQGRIYSIDPATGTLATLHEFTAGPNGMKQVGNDLILGGDGLLYGITAYNRGLPLAPTTATASTTPTGTLYRIDPKNPASFAVLHTFTLAEGELNVLDNTTHEGFVHYPSGVPLVIGEGGAVTSRALVAGQERSLSSLVDGGDGYLYGATSIGDCYVYTASPAANSTLTTVTRDSPLCGYRHQPPAERTTYSVPYPYYDAPRAYGALYRIPRNGSGPLQVIHTFSEADGATPRGSLALGADGAIYGTTLAGGAQTCPSVVNTEPAVGCGTVYRFRPAAIVQDAGGQVTSAGFEQVHRFTGNDGRQPLGLRAAADGRIYGVAAKGGSYSTSTGAVVPTNYGTVFQITPSANTQPTASASLVATPVQIKAGEETSLTWITSNTTNCSAASSGGDWKGAVAGQGSIRFTPAAGTYRYTLTCNVAGGAAGLQVAADTTVYVSTVATAEDGNTVKFGNGGGGSLPAAALLPLAGLGWLAVRRRLRRAHRAGYRA